MFEIDLVEPALSQKIRRVSRPFDKVRVIQGFRDDVHTANYTGVMAQRKCALWLALAVPLLAQNTGSVEGSVTNSITHAGIGGVAVTVTGKTAYRATTDAAGEFRITAMNSGDYVVTFEAPDFIVIPPIRIFRPIPCPSSDR